MHIKTTKVYQMNENSLKNKSSIVVHQGGSRSGKTYNILIWFIIHCLTDWNREVIDVGRKTFPSLRSSVMYDFFNILKDNGLYFEENHNKTENTYVINNNLFRFFSVDMEQKIRGASRSYLFLNEANEFSEDEFKQLNQRTTKLTILDYNPSDEFHWIYEKIIPRDDCDFYKTTYVNNPFLSSRIVKEIEAYKGIDENYWRIYGLGEKGLSETTIFTHWEYFDENKNFDGEEFFGLDFGYNHPTALVKVKYSKGKVYAKELLYKSGYTSTNIIDNLNKLVADGKLKRTDRIIADSSRPEIIEEIYDAGFNVFNTKKEKGSVLRGINFLKINKFYIDKESLNLIKELKSYKWSVDRTGRRLDDPVKINDDCLDAVRYALEEVSKLIEKPNIKFG
jgi:phage terminase large subunit